MASAGVYTGTFGRDGAPPGKLGTRESGVGRERGWRLPLYALSFPRAEGARRDVVFSYWASRG